MSAGKTNQSYTIRNSTELVKGGNDYFDLLRQLIKSAKNTIYIRIYIWDDDETGTTIAEQLIQAARAGVKVYIIADGYASQGLSKTFLSNLKNAGINFRYFEPFLRSSHFYFGRRMHEKIVVIDQDSALIGGINFADHYNDIDHIPAWLDFALFIKGASATELYSYCVYEWNKDRVPILLSEKLKTIKQQCSVRIRYNDWVKGKQQIWKTYFNWFHQADTRISIMCSYFLPGRVLRNQLSKASKRGVKVKLILAGPSDVKLAKYAERYLYRWILKNDIEIYEYQPSILHAKMMVVDNHWVTIGSYNVNNVSAYASKEVNADIRNKPFARTVQRLMDSIIEKDCVQITDHSPLFKMGWFKKFIQKSSYELIRVILNLSTFYFKQE